MTTATETLRKEHEAILRMLDAAEEVARQLEAGIAVAPSTLSGLLEFLRVFADRCHHGKEEDCLFPKLEQKGMPSHGGPIGIMLMEHDLGRGYIRDMAAASDAYLTGQPDAARNWAAAAHNYADLLRGHIGKENNILFVMAERILSDSDQAELSEAFENVEEMKLGKGTHERLHALMDSLTAEIFPKATAASQAR